MHDHKFFPTVCFFIFSLHRESTRLDIIQGRIGGERRMRAQPAAGLLPNFRIGFRQDLILSRITASR